MRLLVQPEINVADEKTSMRDDVVIGRSKMAENLRTFFMVLATISLGQRYSRQIPRLNHVDCMIVLHLLL